MEKYHVGDTGPPIDWLLKRDGEIIDPSGANSITANVRIKGQTVFKFQRTLSVITDGDGNKRVRMTFIAGNLSIKGAYQAQAVLVWPDNSETSPDPHEFEVLDAWPAP